MKDKNTEVATLIKRFLNYSFEDIDYDYDSLTDKEKGLCSKDEFKKLIAWLFD